MTGELLDLQAIGAATIAEYAPDEDFAAESVAVVEPPNPITDFRPRFSHAGYASIEFGAAS